MAASLSVTNIVCHGATLNLNNLDYYLRDYNIKYDIISSFNEAFTTGIMDGATYDPNGIYNGLQMLFEYWFTPNKNYTFNCYVRYPKNTGSWTQVGSSAFSTIDITRPSASSSYPNYYPSIRDQVVRVGDNEHGQAYDCVACALSTTLDMFEYIERGITNNLYSISWIYGNRRNQTENNTETSGMYANISIASLISDGSPVWNTVRDNKTDKSYPDNRFYSDNYNGAYETGAYNMFTNQELFETYAAHVQNIASSTNVHFYDSIGVSNAITANGCYVFSFSVPNNFYNIGSNGIAPSPDSYSGSNHCMLLIGWKTISSVKYWIAQNSWGLGFGDNGLVYIPMDWCAAQASPSNNFYNWWCWWGQAPVNKVSDNPGTPTSLTLIARTDIDIGSKLYIGWVAANFCSTYDIGYKTTSGGSRTVSLTNIVDIYGYIEFYFNYGNTYWVSVRGNSYKGNGSVTSDVRMTTVPSRPGSITAEQPSDKSHTVDVSFTKGRSGTYAVTTDINWTRDLNNWGTVQYVAQTGTSYNIDVTNWTSPVYFRFRSNMYDGVETIYSDWIPYSTVSLIARPSNFAWTTTITQGGNIHYTNLGTKSLYIITADEWNAFTAKINEFRVYKALSNYSFTSVSLNTVITKAIINEAIYAITDITGRTINPPALRVTGDKINLASLYIDLKNSLNSTE